MCFGKFYKTNSIIHGVDTRIKIILMLFWITLILMANSVLDYAVVFTFAVFTLILSKVPLKVFLKSLKPIIFITIFSVLINLFFTQQGIILWSFNAITITDYGVSLALSGMFKLLFIGTFAAFLTLTSSPLEISHAIESLLSPLKKIIPYARDFAMAVGISISMIPVLYDESKKLKISMLSRGVDFEQKNIFVQIKNYVPLLIPLVVNSLNRADQLSLAITMRGYNENAQLKNEHIALKAVDIAAILIFIVSAYLILQNIWLLLVFLTLIALFLVLNVCKVL